MNFGDRLKSERKRLGLTQDNLAVIAGITVQSQRMYEAGKRFPNTVYLDSISSAGADIQFLIAGHPSTNAKQLYSEPTEALDVVLSLQSEFWTFTADQLKALLGYAYMHQVDGDGLREFINMALAFKDKRK